MLAVRTPAQQRPASSRDHEPRGRGSRTARDPLNADDGGGILRRGLVLPDVSMAGRLPVSARKAVTIAGTLAGVSAPLEQVDALDATIVIVNYNGRGILGPCLDGCARQVGCSLETIVIDNASRRRLVGRGCRRRGRAARPQRRERRLRTGLQPGRGARPRTARGVPQLRLGPGGRLVRASRCCGRRRRDRGRSPGARADRPRQRGDDRGQPRALPRLLVGADRPPPARARPARDHDRLRGVAPRTRARGSTRSGASGTTCSSTTRTSTSAGGCGCGATASCASHAR